MNAQSYELNPDAINVILAALRYLQRDSDSLPGEIGELAEDSLARVDIDDLCEHLNFGGGGITHTGQHEVLLSKMRAELSRPEWNSDTSASLATELADAGWPIFFPENEGWYLEVIDGAYAVVPRADGPFRSETEAMVWIATRFSEGSTWHGQVLDVVGMTACGHQRPLLEIEGYAANAIDVVVMNPLMPQQRLEVGYRQLPQSVRGAREAGQRGAWNLYRRKACGEAEWIEEHASPLCALKSTASLLGAGFDDQTLQRLISYFE
ncbi:hypothetical protein [Salinicola endophyticus]|uniref:Uncharacterized protein n=1 Tax=Salinicola endophyticus TaxID=1949083 RepID=A0AB74UAH3_9GAMM